MQEDAAGPLFEGKAEDVRDVLSGLEGGPGRAVLVVEPNPDQQSRLARLVTVRGHRAIGTSSLDGARAFLKAFPVDLVLLAQEALEDTALAVVAELTHARPHARIVIMTAADPSPSPSLRSLEHVQRPFGGEVLTRLLSGAPL